MSDLDDYRRECALDYRRQERRDRRANIRHALMVVVLAVFAALKLFELFFR